MIIRISRSKLEEGMTVALGILLLGALFAGITLTADQVSGATNITNRTVLAIVNITNTEPNITAIVIDDNESDPADEIDLIANNVTIVHCNATVFDFNGWEDINASSVNATLYINSESSDGDPDNNFLYRNESCGSCIQGDTATEAECRCQFAVQYYANDSNQWACNVTLHDNGGTAGSSDAIPLRDSDVSSTVTITKLLAIDVGPLIDYGNLSVTQTSGEHVHNVTNVGNIDLNLSLRGYGGTDDDLGRNVTMICELGNITFGHQRYAFGTENTGATSFAGMFNLTNQTRLVDNSTLPQRIDDAAYGWDRNATIWRLQVPLSVAGFCNGTIIFGAVDAEV